jgi:hypothetical protein
MYFEKFPIITYPFLIDGKEVYKPIIDITSNARVRSQILNNITLFDPYDIRDGDTPELISYRFYKTTQYHWIIMLTNNYYDYLNDFPMHSNVLDEYIKSKYSMDQIGDPHHWEKDGLVVDPYTLDSYPVSNFDYEVRKNDLKRRIRVIKSNLIQAVVHDLIKLI